MTASGVGAGEAQPANTSTDKVNGSIAFIDRPALQVDAGHPASLVGYTITRAGALRRAQKMSWFS
jgi:hypothetical protein